MNKQINFVKPFATCLFAVILLAVILMVVFASCTKSQSTACKTCSITTTETTDNGGHAASPKVSVRTQVECGTMPPAMQSVTTGSTTTVTTASCK